MALWSSALDELDPDAVNSFDEGEAHRDTTRKRERPRFGSHLDVLHFERRDGIVDILRTKSDVVDRVAGARRGFAFGRENPNAAVIDPINNIFQFADRTAELVHIPCHRRTRIRSTQMNVMQSEPGGILNDFEPRTEWVYDETDLHQSGHFASGRLDFRAVRFHRLHRRFNVLDRKADVVNHAARAWRWLLVPLKNDPCLAEHQPVGPLRRWLTSEILPVPFHGLDRIRSREVHVVDHVCKTGLCGDRRRTSRDDECRSSHYPQN